MDNRQRFVGLVKLAFILAGLVAGHSGWAQQVEEAFNENAFTPLENSIQEERVEGFLLDNTRTKIGRDFYEFFYQHWMSVQADESIISPEVFNQIGEELTITLDEQPAQATTTIISLSVNDQIIWQQFLQPRLGALEELVQSAVEAVTEYVVNYQEYQSQLGNEDQSGTGIY